MKKICYLDNNCGFTLVELMITLVIGSLIAAALYSTYILQQKTYQSQSSVTEMQQNVRAGLDYLILDLRMAGYDPLGAGIGSIEVADRTSLKFTADMDENGEIGTSAKPAAQNEVFEYGVANSTVNGVTIPTLKRSATTDGSQDLQPMADYIDYLEFVYFDKDGTELTSLPLSSADRENVRSVVVSIIARTAKPDRKYTNTTLYTLPSGSTWLPGGVTSPPTAPAAPGDQYRRRVITTQVDLRNMGL